MGAKGAKLGLRKWREENPPTTSQLLKQILNLQKSSTGFPVLIDSVVQPRTSFLQNFPFLNSAVPGWKFHRVMGKRKKARVSEEPRVEQVQEDVPEEPMTDEGEASGSADGKSLYEILGVDQTATQQEIKKAYHKLALRLHPDKNPGDEQAKEKFQQLQKVISILGDEEKRALYDQTGVIDDEDLAGDADSLREFFKAMYKKVTEADIEEFEANYRGSDSEKKDLLNLYKEFKGDMKRLFSSMLCSDPLLDSHRFKDIIDEAIASGELKETKAFKKWSKKISEMKPPTSPLRRRQGSSKKSSDSDLYAMISKRRSERKDQFDNMFSSLISKYGGGPSEKVSSEPTEEEFEAVQKRMEKARKKASKKSSKN